MDRVDPPVAVTGSITCITYVIYFIVACRISPQQSTTHTTLLFYSTANQLFCANHHRSVSIGSILLDLGRSINVLTCRSDGGDTFPPTIIGLLAQ